MALFSARGSRPSDPTAPDADPGPTRPAPPPHPPPVAPEESPPPAASEPTTAGGTFHHDLPDSIDPLLHPAAAAVEVANRLGTLDPTRRALAEKAWKEVSAHAARLESDAFARSAEAALAHAVLPHVKNGEHVQTKVLPPFVVIYASKERHDEWRALDDPGSGASSSDVARDASEVRETLDRVAGAFHAVYDEFLRRYALAADLVDLARPYGGRPDLPLGKRSFAEGFPLLVWVRRSPDEVPMGPRFYESFRSQDDGAESLLNEMAILDAPAKSRLEEIAVAQVLQAFRRQKNEWAHVYVPATFFGAGFPTLLARAVRGDRSERSPFEGPLPAFVPTHDLVGADRPPSPPPKVPAMGDAEPPGPAIPRAEAWALLHFLDRGADGKRHDAFTRFVADMLSSDVRVESYAPSKFVAEFGLNTPADWEAFDAEFRPWYETRTK
jgi:hypothetical protein